MWFCLWEDSGGWLTCTQRHYFCKPKTIVHLVLHGSPNATWNTVEQFFQSAYCQRSTSVLDFRFLSTSYHNSKTASDATQRQMFLELRETFRQTPWCSWCLFNFIQALCCSFLFMKYPKRLGSDCLEVLFLVHTLLHCTIVLSEKTGLGMIQGCQTDMEIALDLIHIQLVKGVSPGGKNQCFLIHKLQIIWYSKTQLS